MTDAQRTDEWEVTHGTKSNSDCCSRRLAQHLLIFLSKFSALELYWQSDKEEITPSVQIVAVCEQTESTQFLKEGI